MSLLLRNASILAPESLGPGSVLIQDGKIAAVYKQGEDVPGVETIDLRGAALGPGLIDLHVHGGDGNSLMDGGEAAAHIARFVVRYGVTGLLPATVTASFEDTARAVESVRQAMAQPTGGARVLGVYLEGPFLSPKQLGAQSPEFCILPTAENVVQLLEIAGDVAKIVAIAPEVEGGIEAVKIFVEQGLVVSVGHTAATTEQAMVAFAAGASQATHLFNAMPSLHHREPGTVGAALTVKEVCAEIIVDGVHLAPTTVRLVLAAKGVEGIILITDAISATGCPDGQYMLGPMKVFVHKGEARLEAGNLAGSTLTLDRAVTNVAAWTDVGLSGAWQMASLNPARQLGLDDHLGRIAPGYDADLTAMDIDGHIVLTLVGGEVVYRRS